MFDRHAHRSAAAVDSMELLGAAGRGLDLGAKVPASS
jgi:hypothetical protein